MSLADDVASVAWYHTIALPGGIVTPGYFDTLSALPKVPLPPSLEGKRCLDVGTCDGFWAFELERRGASEVVGTDLADPADRDWPEVGVPQDQRAPDRGRAERTFGIAKNALDSSVERREVSIYDLSPDTVGTFDFVFIGSLLLHLRDPVGALTAVRSVVNGELFCAEAVSLPLSVLSPFAAAATLSRQPQPRWWTPNLAGLRQLVRRAGFEVDASGGPFFIPFGAGFPRPSLRAQVARPAQLGFWLAAGRLGSPSAWIRAHPTAA